MRRKRNQKYMFMFGVFSCLLCMMVVGYAAFSTNLNINVKGNIGKKGITSSDLIKNVVTEGDGLYKDAYEEGKYIFRGANPNNYVIFNNELWRIVALEPDKENPDKYNFKIMKNQALTSKKFDSTTLRDTDSSVGGTYCSLRSGYGCNSWSTNNNFVNGSVSGSVLKDAEINLYLNGEYYNSIKNEDKLKIIKGVFNVGGAGISDTNLSTTISEEKSYQWEGNIALPTVSEYVRASTNSSCTNVYMYYYQINDNCSTNNLNHNWMFNILTKNGSSYGWLLSPYHSYSSRLLYVYISGSLGNGDANGNKDGFIDGVDRNVVPILYLDSNIRLNGDGTETEPYTIKQ